MRKPVAPNGEYVSYQLQFRKCGKTRCRTCATSKGHGPYWYAYWRTNGKLRSAYVGKRLLGLETPVQDEQR